MNKLFIALNEHFKKDEEASVTMTFTKNTVSVRALPGIKDEEVKNSIRPYFLKGIEYTEELEEYISENIEGVLNETSKIGIEINSVEKELAEAKAKSEALKKKKDKIDADFKKAKDKALKAIENKKEKSVIADLIKKALVLKSDKDLEDKLKEYQVKELF